MCRVLITSRRNIKTSAEETENYKDPKQHKTTFGEDYSKSWIKESNIYCDAYTVGAKLIKIS
jgi:hypothetical protein